MLQVRDLAVEVGGRFTLTDASFSLHAGDKVGLVGRNGAGKTSLLKVLAGEAPPARGVVLRPRRRRLPRRRIRPPRDGADGTALAHVLSGRGLDAAARRLDELRERVDARPVRPQRARVRQRRGRVPHARAATPPSRKCAASRPGSVSASDRLDLPVSALSGGERRRVELARILFAGSELLLLDEPTNHLDIDAKAWLMSFLRSFRGALLVISHDLALLDQAITRVLHLDEGELIEYRGTYSQYLVARKADEERRAKIATRQDQEIRRLRTLADSMRHQTEKRARIAKTLDHRVDKLNDQTHRNQARGSAPCA